MFKSFFGNRKWWAWSLGGSLIILLATWYRVELDVQINQWFGEFYDTIQQVLKKPNSMTFPDFMKLLLKFAQIAGISMIVAVLGDFFGRHYIFRWREAMTEYYQSHWEKVRHIEGSSQRIQEDTMRFAKIMETLGVSFLQAILTLIAFLPLLWELSKQVTQMPWIGHVDHALVYLALLFSLAGTVILAVVGIKLPGLEFNNQKVEAAYRKELVLGEDRIDRAQPPVLKDLFEDIRKNNYRLYWHYMYFDLARWSYLQFAVIVPYITLAPSLLMGLLTLGTLQQIVRAFNKVQDSFQFLVQSWTTIVELLSIYKRLKGFEQQIRG
ncbi:putative transporter [Simonsiella muelleri]|uniref:putative transporter n=1 Tax=Simonsiella muelleri TaxID=72 RepID=UPI0023F10AED|nr:putative transporter [Simonsiella muelleri]